MEKLERRLLFSHARLLFSFLAGFALSVSGVHASGNVTMESLIIFRTHEWIGKPSVYFMCHGENKVYLPDVVEKDHQYKFIGEESWQPLTILEDAKCKRCGFYEEDKIKQDDVFDEWELCPHEFTTAPRYIHFKEKEFNATFLCSVCGSSSSRPDHSSENAEDERERKKNGLGLAVVLVVFGCAVVIAIAFVGFSRWQQKRREEQHARFIKLFEEDDDLEAELGLRDI